MSSSSSDSRSLARHLGFLHLPPPPASTTLPNPAFETALLDGLKLHLRTRSDFPSWTSAHSLRYTHSIRQDWLTDQSALADACALSKTGNGKLSQWVATELNIRRMLDARGQRAEVFPEPADRDRAAFVDALTTFAASFNRTIYGLHRVAKCPRDDLSWWKVLGMLKMLRDASASMAAAAGSIATLFTGSATLFPSPIDPQAGAAGPGNHEHGVHLGQRDPLSARSRQHAAARLLHPDRRSDGHSHGREVKSLHGSGHYAGDDVELSRREPGSARDPQRGDAARKRPPGERGARIGEAMVQ